MSDRGDMITVREAARRKKCVKQRIYQLIEQGRLEAELGDDGILRVPADALNVPPLPRGPKRRAT